MVHLDYRDAKPIYTQIVENFRKQIAAGVLQPGDKLPSVRELAARLSINPNTIQRAYRELEQQGVIETLPGKGCFVCAAADTPDWTKLESAVAQLLSQGVSREEILRHIGGMQDA
ncbi:MAG: GntR family transcriptional regulator [Oscillospiraceae bacterium]|nr:GntR family transcriptional regulator [Oscillospiraceae bacterium]